MLTGHCLCGAVQYELHGKPGSLTVCHCGMCRRWHGALGAYANGKAGDYRIRGAEHIRWFQSSDDAERGFCGRCGSKLFWREKGGQGSMDVTAGTLGRPTGLSTTAHIWVAHKGDYYRIEDGAPQFIESSTGAAIEGQVRSPVEIGYASRHGQCLCGAIHMKVHGPIRQVVWCHCGQCLHWHGHFPGYTAAKWESIELSGDAALTWYQSSDKARRGFCSVCGSSLFWEASHKQYVSIAAGALDLPTGLVTARHIFAADKSDYYELGQGAEAVPGSMAANPVAF